MSYINNRYVLLGILKGVNLAVSAPADLGFIAINNNENYSDIIVKTTVVSSSGTLALATLSVNTASGGGGTNIIAATALTNLATTNAVQTLSSALTSTINTNSIYIRLTVAALNAGTADIAIFGYKF